MTDLTQYEMAQFDAQEFAVIQQRDRVARSLDGFLLTAHRMLDKKRGLGSKLWMLTDAQVEAKLAEKAAGNDERSLSFRIRPSELIKAIADARQLIGELNTQVQDLENAYGGRWQRYFPCLNADGHIHSSLRGCKTVRWDTDMGWATQYSGLTPDQAIHGTGLFPALGETLCSVCFPDAPVEWCQSKRDITRAQRDAEREAKRQASEAAAAEKEARRLAREAKAAQPRKETPQERRWAGVKAVCDKWADGVHRAGFETQADRELIAADIEALLELGRSERWQGAVAAWAEAVRDDENPVSWAFTQYSIYAGHAA